MANILKLQYNSVFSPPVNSESLNYNDFEQFKKYHDKIMPDININSQYIDMTVNRMKNNAAPGPDGAISPCYKHGGEFMKEALSDIYSLSLDQGIAPLDTKEAWINPVWKGQDKTDPSNYRPIALTNQFSKGIETIIRERIISHMESVGMIDPSQHGSTKGKSTVTQLIDQQMLIVKMLESGDNVEIVYLDFAKAYDRISHSILIRKLFLMGVRGNTLKWIQDWLTNRRQRVRISNSLSEWDTVLSGIPQGSMLGSLLFIIYIWDLNVDNLTDPKILTQVYKYVDDTKVITRVKTEEDIIETQCVLEHIYEWQHVNNMTWNGSIFVRISCGRNDVSENTLIFTPNTGDPIESNESAKDLEIWINNDCSFKKQKEQAIMKTKKKCSWILRTFRSRDPYILKTLWKSLCQSIQDYGSQIWSPHNNSTEIAAQEQPLREFTRYFGNYNGLNYWE